MKILLERPFVDKWRLGYIRTTPSGRKLVDLYNSDQDRTTISYARYKKSVELGFLLSKEYEVDHIDGDRTNDDLRNLQILGKKEHLEKTLKERPKRKTKNLICPVCGNQFTKFENQIKKGSIPKCSRSCNGRASTLIQLLKQK